MSFDGDFVDLFEVRGMQRAAPASGCAEVGASEVVLPYRAGTAPAAARGCGSSPRRGHRRRPRQLRAAARPRPGERTCTAACCASARRTRAAGVGYEPALRENNAARAAARGVLQRDHSNPLVNLWLDRSVSDLAMLTTSCRPAPTRSPACPGTPPPSGATASSPRSNTCGSTRRSRAACWLPGRHAGHRADPERDAEPGKILHEARASEMANTREIPFGRYYGTVDATPLFVVLAGAYYRAPATRPDAQRSGPTCCGAALDRPLRRPDGDGFVEYARSSKDGLVQQGWKDSHDSVFHADGRMATAPIALCEVQGYVYQARACWPSCARHGRRRARGAAGAAGGALARKLPGRVLVRRARAATRSRWTAQAAMPRAVLQRRPLPVERHRAPEHARAWIATLMGPRSSAAGASARSRRASRATTRCRITTGRSGRTTTRSIAPGMARYGRTAEAAAAAVQPVRCEPAFRPAPPAGTLLRIPARGGAGPDAVPGRLLAAGLGGRGAVRDAAGLPGLEMEANGRGICLHTRGCRLRRLDADRPAGRARAPDCDLLLQRHERSVGVEVLRKDPQVSVTVVA
jgi:hypothetical protein